VLDCKQKAHLRRKLKAEDRWDEFVDNRERLKQKSIPPERAWELAYEAYKKNTVPEVPDAPAAAKEKPSSPQKESSIVDLSKQFTRDFLDATRNASITEIVNFVFNSIDIPTVRPKDAPCAGAWSLLQAVQRDEQLKYQFYTSVWPRMIPSKSELEKMTAYQDDGREELSVIERLQREFKKEKGT